MQAWWIKSSQGRMVLEAKTLDIPLPQAHQMRVKIHAAALNRGEMIAGHGLHAGDGQARPAGFEASGVVEALGEACQEFRVGDRVMGRCDGAFAQYGLMNVGEALAVPPSMTWAQAACTTVTYLTAHDALIAQGKIKPGDWLLVNGIASGVGVAALQLAKALGAKVIGTSGSAHKLESLKAMGLDVGICSRGADFVDAVMQATAGRGADIAVNTVGGSVLGAVIEALGFEGRLAIVGYVDGVVQANVNLLSIHKKRLSIYGVSNKLRTVEQRIQAVRDFQRDLYPYLESGALTPYIEAVFSFAQLPEAQKRMESNDHLGKLVLQVTD